MSSLVYARQAPPAAWRRTSNQAQAATAPRAMLAAGEADRAPQPQDRLGCETSWSPASPSFASSDLLSTTFCAALDEAAALSDTMHRAAAASYMQQHQQHRHASSSSSSNSTASDTGAANTALKTDPSMAANYELDRDMMGMLATNWTLSTGPPRAPVANWGFEPTPAEAQAMYDPDALLAGGNQQQAAALSGSMMMAPPAISEMTHIVGMTVGPGFASTNAPNTQQAMGAPTDPFSGMDGGFAMPYQDCATLPVGDFPLYDAGGMYKPPMDAAAAGLNQFGPAVVDNQLDESSVPYFGGNSAVMGVGAMYQGTMANSSAGPLFNEVAQPPAASMAAINGSFAMPDLSLQEDDDSDWNGSSSGFSTVSSSPVANGVLPKGQSTSSSTPTSAPASLTSSRNSMNKDGSKKPKRIRRLCSVAGCGKRARSQDLCIAHGGGRRCMVEGCEKSSQGGNMCIKHGGGKRCKHPGCDKAAQTNSLCKAHGGGPRCQYPGCTKSSQGGGFCRAHGGGKRCAAEGCNKGTQRGNFCALHGGSRFCEVPGCMRNDRGGGFCAHHGGGKRCSIANCNRSCRRNGLCSTHLRLLGHEAGGTFSNDGPAAISTAMPTSTGVTSV